MTDMARLLDGLQTYEHQLELHSMQVSDSFDQLTKALDRLSAVYEGTAAKEFKAHFARTRDGLAEYSEGTKAIRHLLRERIERLAAADRATDLG